MVSFFVRFSRRSGFALTTDGLATVLSHLISQLRPGADLSRVVLPTFILEPRSMLERITKYGTIILTTLREDFVPPPLARKLLFWANGVRDRLT